MTFGNNESCQMALRLNTSTMHIGICNGNLSSKCLEDYLLTLCLHGKCKYVNVMKHSNEICTICWLIDEILNSILYHVCDIQNGLIYRTYFVDYAFKN